MDPEPTAANAPGPRPIAALEGVRAYSVPRAGAPVDLHLDANEGPEPAPEMVEALRSIGPDALRRYPDASPLEAELAARFGVAPPRVLATAGGDDAIDRLLRATLGPGANMVVATPTFEMIPRGARLAGAETRAVPWPGGPHPTDGVIARIDDATRVVCVVSPNNPTGAAAPGADIARVARAAPHAVVLADLAYAEFAGEDPTRELLGLGNVVVVRTLSKAWGLAGVRVGYAIGPERIVGWMRAAGGPYAVSGPSVALALAAVRSDPASMDRLVARVRSERSEIESLLGELGASAEPSDANFVLARVRDPLWLRDALAGLGIGVRAFPGREGLEDAVRVTCPGSEAGMSRLAPALRAALAPEAILFDLDGVIADVTDSYRLAILETASGYGVTLSAGDVARAKAAGGANNDWVLTRELLARAGVDAPLGEVTERFESIYQGTAGRPGLRERESLLVEPALLERLAGRVALAVVTGRPRADAERFLDDHGIRGAFRAVVCMEDGPSKPEPDVVREAMSRLGVASAWMVGDTPDDCRAARAAGVVPVGILAPGDRGSETMRAALVESGAGRVIDAVDELEGLLP